MPQAAFDAIDAQDGQFVDDGASLQSGQTNGQHDPRTSLAIFLVIPDQSLSQTSRDRSGAAQQQQQDIVSTKLQRQCDTSRVAIDVD